MSTRNQQDFCVICSDPFKLDKVNKEKLVVHEITCTFAQSLARKSYSIKYVLSTIYNIGSLWPDDEDDQDKVGACRTCAQVLTNLFIFYEKVNQLLNQESILFQMIRVLEQITGPKGNHVQLDTGQPGTIIKMNQNTEQSSTIDKLQEITGQQRQNRRNFQQQQQITLRRVTFNTGPKPQTTKKVQEIVAQSEIVKKLNNLKEPSGQNESINKSSSLRHIRKDHDYLPPFQYARAPYRGQRSQPVPPKENNRNVNEQKSWLSKGSTTLRNSKSDENQKPLTTVSSAEEKVNDRHQEDDDVDMSTPCHEPNDNGQDEIVIENITVHPPSTVAAMSTSPKSIESAAPLNEIEDIEIKTEFMTCGTCQKIFIYEKNLEAHRKICKRRRKIFPLPSQKFRGTTHPLKKSSAQNQQQQGQGSTTFYTKGSPPSSLHLPTIRKRLGALATPFKSIVCSICRTKVGNVEDCIIHLNRSHFPFNCTKCHIIYSTSISWEQHMSKEHCYNNSSSSNNNNNSSSSNNNNKSSSSNNNNNGSRRKSPAIEVSGVRCSLCRRKFYGLSYLQNHHCIGHSMKVVPGFRCVICLATFTTKRRLKCHSMSSHEPKKAKKVCDRQRYYYSKTPIPLNGSLGTNRNHKCSTCDKYFGSRQTLFRHVKIHWPNRCHLCQKRFETAAELSSHTLQCQGIKRPFVCTHGDPTCGLAFRTNFMLAHHIRQHHTGERELMCHICAKTFVYRSSLAKHLRSHMKDTTRFVCTVEGCGKSYVLRQSLAIHMNTHLGIKGFLCTVCGTGYTQKHFLDFHMKMIHNTGDLPFECPSCPKRFPVQCYLTAHLKARHAERPFKCTFCGKGFTNNAALEIHSRIHIGCSICGLVLPNNRAKGQHMKKHEREKNYELSKKQKKGRRTKVAEESLNDDDDDDHDDEQEKDSNSSSGEEDASA